MTAGTDNPLTTLLREDPEVRSWLAALGPGGRSVLCLLDARSQVLVAEGVRDERARRRHAWLRDTGDGRGADGRPVSVLGATR